MSISKDWAREKVEKYANKHGMYGRDRKLFITLLRQERAATRRMVKQVRKDWLVKYAVRGTRYYKGVEALDNLLTRLSPRKR